MEDNHTQGTASINTGILPQILFILQKNTAHRNEKGGENKGNAVFGLLVLVMALNHNINCVATVAIVFLSSFSPIAVTHCNCTPC